MLKSKVSAVFQERRQRLMAREPGSVFILPSPHLSGRYVSTFRQDGDLFYLSGFDEPVSLLVLAPGGAQGSHRFVIFVQKRDREKEMWEGERYGMERTCSVFGAHEAYDISEFEQRMPDLLKGAEKLFYRQGRDFQLDQKITGILEKHLATLGRTGLGLLPIHDPVPVIGELRLFKSDDEVTQLKKAAEISKHAHEVAMRETRPGMHEYEVQALIEHIFRKHGANGPAYYTIVAGGKNATCLHYHANNEVLRAGDLLLIDAGADFEYYPADITRTFPVSKHFSKEQAEIYDLVLLAQDEAYKIARPGTYYQDLHKTATDVIAEGLLSLGILKGKKDDLVKNGSVRKFFPHGTGHWLGIDVHDSGLYKPDGQPRPLEPGMVFTIEPGIYFQPEDSDYPEKYRGIGVRIEDDILITAQGADILTAPLAKSRSEIEKLR